MRIVVPAKTRCAVWSPGLSRNTVRRLNGPDHFDTLIQSHVLPAEAGTPNLRALAAKSGTTNGFTMVEIAIAVAVIAFALVAIIGVLPAGLQVQKENREDTLMAQDGTYWMEAIRNGAAGLDELGQYVSRIEISNGNVTNAYTDFTPSALSSGAQIIGLLGTPGTVNTATVRAIAGALSEKGSATADIAFKYKMQVTIFPFDASTTPVARDSVENQVLSARLHEVRLLFRWPILPNGSLGNGRQVLRSLVSGEFVTVTNAGKIYYFLRP